MTLRTHLISEGLLETFDAYVAKRPCLELRPDERDAFTWWANNIGLGLAEEDFWQVPWLSDGEVVLEWQ